MFQLYFCSAYASDYSIYANTGSIYIRRIVKFNRGQYLVYTGHHVHSRDSQKLFFTYVKQIKWITHLVTTFPLTINSRHIQQFNVYMSCT